MSRRLLPALYLSGAIPRGGLGAAPGGTPSPTPTPTPTPDPPSWSTQPSITGTPQVGETLTGDDGVIVDGTVSARAWLRDDAEISGATGSTYALQEADEAADISYRVTATGEGGTASATSDPVGPVAAAPVPADPDPTTGDTYDTAFNNTTAVYAADDRVVTNTEYLTVRSLLAHHAGNGGKFYAEFYSDPDSPTGLTGAGICTPAKDNTGGFVAGQTAGVNYDGITDTEGNGRGYYFGGFAPGTTLRVAVDFDNGVFFLRHGDDGYGWNAFGDDPGGENPDQPDNGAPMTWTGLVHLCLLMGTAGQRVGYRSAPEDFQFDIPAGYEPWENVNPAAPVVDDRYKIVVTGDIDPGNERDDEAGASLFLADQTRNNIKGLIADAPDGLVSGWAAMLTPYESDYAKVSSYGTAGQYKTKAELEAITVQGARSDAPSRGYFIAGDAEYAAAEAAADLIIAAAQDASPVGTFQTNPKNKLLVISQGGAVSMAQALNKAVTRGVMPDFCNRVVWLVQSKHNSYMTQNAWKWIMAQHWQSAGVPGNFGALQIINPCYQAYTCNDEAAPAEQVWNYVRGCGAMGLALEAERIASNYTNLYFRAGDGWFYWFLKECDRLGSYDPANPALRCGALRTITNGTRYPWVTGTWGPSDGAGGWPTTGTTDSPYSPNHYIPPDSVVGINSAKATSNIDDWYDEVVLKLLARYKAANADQVSAMVTNEWLFSEGSGQAANNAVAGKPSLRMGSSTGADAADPAWSPQGIEVLSGDYAFGANDVALNGNTGHTWAAMVRLNAVNTGANQTIIGRDASGNNATRQFQLRFEAGRINGFWRYGATTTTTPVGGAGRGAPLATANVWVLVTLHLNRDKTLILRVNGVEIDRNTLPGTPNSGDNYSFTIGSRDGSDPLNGKVGLIMHGERLLQRHLPAFEQKAVADFLAAHPTETFSL